MIIIPTPISVVQPAAEPSAAGVSIAWMLIAGFFLLIAILFVLGIIGVIIYFIIKYIKFKDDIFYQIRKDRKKLCKLHGENSRSKQPIWKFWKIDLNDKVVTQWQDDKGEMHTKEVGYYKGHYETDDAILISFVDSVHKFLFFLPQTNILILNKKAEYTIKTRDEQTKKIERIKMKFPTIKLNFTNNMVIIFAKGIEKAGYFFTPIVTDKKGNTIDMKLPAFISARDVALSEYLYQQTADFTTIAKKHIDFNPNVKYNKEVGDANSTIDSSPP